MTSTEGLVVKKNRLTPSDPTQFVPPLSVRTDWGTNLPAAVSIEGQ